MRILWEYLISLEKINQYLLLMKRTNRLSYLEQTLDDMHIIDVEFDGIFEKFYYVIVSYHYYEIIY